MVEHPKMKRTGIGGQPSSQGPSRTRIPPMANRLMHKLQSGHWRVVDAPDDWDEETDGYPVDVAG